MENENKSSNTLEILALENGSLVISSEVSKIISQYEESKKILEENEKKLREELIKAMLTADIKSAKVGDYTLSLVVPKNTVVFDEKSFLEKEEDKEVVRLFSHTFFQEKFDVISFEKENKELYEKYLIKTPKTEVSSVALKTSYPKIYEKYVSEVVSDKAISIRIAKSK
jgi:uncharacterized membrane protein